MCAKKLTLQAASVLSKHPRSSSPFGIVTDTESLGGFTYLDPQVRKDGRLATGAMRSQDFTNPLRKDVPYSFSVTHFSSLKGFLYRN